MNTIKQMDEKISIFINLLRVANRLENVLDENMDELTVKQWFVVIMLQLCDTPPNLKELSAMCDSSYQNTKQIVLKLQSKGLVKIEKDSYDGRAMRISVADKSLAIQDQYSDITKYFFNVLFSELSEKEISITCRVLSELHNKIQEVNYQQ